MGLFNLNFNSKFDYNENRINEIVYELYELTEEDIKIIEK